MRLMPPVRLRCLQTPQQGNNLGKLGKLILAYRSLTAQIRPIPNTRRHWFGVPALTVSTVIC